MTTIPNDDTLLIEYLDVCNTAMAAKKDSFPHKQALALSMLVFAGRNFSLLLYDHDPDLPDACYTVRFASNQLKLVAEGKQNPVFSCKVKRDYLRKVVGSRQEYIAHPEKLDWDWLKTRFGFGRAEVDKATLVRDLISGELEHLPPRATVREAAVRMRDSDLGALPVLDGERPVGLLTDRDIALRVVAGSLDPDRTMVEEVMTRDVVCCPGDLTAENAAAIMREKRIRRLLVLDADNKPVGLLWLDELEARQRAE